MKLALIGYGAMGKLVETLAVAAGDEIGSKVTSTDASKDAAQVATALRGHDVAIDFSVASAVLRVAIRPYESAVARGFRVRPCESAGGYPRFCFRPLSRVRPVPPQIGLAKARQIRGDHPVPIRHFRHQIPKHVARGRETVQ